MRAPPLASVPIDAIGEFTVETNGMKAEFGRASGAVTFSTKSGTNSVHGNLFEELRNNAMDARLLRCPDPDSQAARFRWYRWRADLYPESVQRPQQNVLLSPLIRGFRNRAGRTPSYQTSLRLRLLGDFRGWTRSGVMVPIYDTSGTRPQPERIGLCRDLFPNKHDSSEPVQRRGHAVHRTPPHGHGAQHIRPATHSAIRLKTTFRDAGKHQFALG